MFNGTMPNNKIVQNYNLATCYYDYTRSISSQENKKKLFSLFTVISDYLKSNLDKEEKGKPDAIFFFLLKMRYVK